MDDDFPRSSDLQIRVEDYRNAWPQALARSMHAASDLLDRIKDISDSQTEHQNRLEVLGGKMPAAIRAAEELLHQRGLAFAQVIDASIERALDSIAALSAQVEHDIQTAGQGAGFQIRQEVATLLATQQQLAKKMELLISTVDHERREQNILTSLVSRQSEELERLRKQVDQLKKKASLGFFRRTLIRLKLANPDN